ncbi:hypothetical protein RFI_34903, partial [Reticulomyxa filosa]
MKWFKIEDMHNCFLAQKIKCGGGMQENNNQGERKYAKEIKTLIQLFGDSINKEDLQREIIRYNGNIELTIKDLVQRSIEKEDQLEVESKKQEQGNAMDESNSNGKSVQKEMEKTEIGETKPGINLQGYCNNETCLVSKAKLSVWINIGFGDITIFSNSTSFSCPDCKKSTVNLIVRALFYNSEHSICASGDSMPVNDNNYQCSYAIKPGLSYELKANKIRQHAKNIEDLRERSERAMNDVEIRNLVTELQKYEIT